MAGEWEDLTLGDLGRVVTGKTPLTAVEGNFGGKIPFVTPSDMDGRKTISTTSRNLTEAGAASVKGSKIPAGSVMVSCIGSDMGKAVIAGRDCVTNQQINSIVVNDRFSSEFVYYNLSTRKDEIRHQVAGGSAQPILNKSDFSRLEITLPPLAEQKAIAAVLGALDDKIELNRRMNATLEAMARALFQSWFVDFNPVRAKLDGLKPEGLDEAAAALFPDSLQDSPIGQIPHGWSVKDLGEIANLDKGLSYKGEGLADEGGLPMVNLGCFTGRGIFNADRLKRYTGEYRERHLINAGDLVIANTDMTQNRVIIGSPALVPELNGAKQFLFTHHVFAVRFNPGSEIWQRYVFFTLLKPEFREIAEGFSTGTTVLALPRDGLMNYSLCLPPVPLLEAFEKQVGPLLSAVDANLHQSRTLATLRDSLLPKLLNGDLSVDNIKEGLVA